MRLLLITPLYPPAVGGAATYFGDIVPHLATYDQIERIVVLTEKISGQLRQSTSAKVDLLRVLPTRVSQQRPYLQHALTYLQTQYWFATQLNKIIKENKIDIVQYHTRFRGKLFYRAMQQQTIPVIADLRDKMSSPQALAAASNQLLCCSYGIYDFARAGGYPPAQIKHIPATFKQIMQPSPTQVASTLQIHDLADQKYVLYIGDMNYNKGVYDLIQAFNIWQKQHPNIKLVLAGTNRDGTKFISAAKKFTNVHYLGYVDRLSVPSLIMRSELLILPSRTEGLPTVILEALALNKKVICPPDIVEFSQYLPNYVLPEINVQQIIEKLDFVWNDAELPSYPLEKHDPEIVAGELVTLYLNL